MVLLDIRQEATVARVDQDQLQAAPASEVEDALLELVDSREDTVLETGNWSYSMPYPGVRYYAFYEPPRPKATGNPALPKAAPRYGAGGGLRR